MIDAPISMLRKGLLRQRDSRANCRKIVESVRGRGEKPILLTPHFVAHERSVVPPGPCRGSKSNTRGSILPRHANAMNGCDWRGKEASAKAKSMCSVLLYLQSLHLLIPRTTKIFCMGNSFHVMAPCCICLRPCFVSSLLSKVDDSVKDF